MNFSFILVEPAVPENVGAAARAIKTMGFERLILVNTSVDKHKKASVLAHGSQDILKNARHVENLTEAFENLDFIVATSAKKRRISGEYSEITSLHGFLERKDAHIKDVGIVFGREESGLTNEELKMADHIITISMPGDYPSLNLSHAVMVVAFELYNATKNVRKKMKRYEDHSDLPDFRHLQSRVEEILHFVGMNHPTIVNRIMERFNLIGSQDINLLHSICAKLEQKLNIKQQ
jgi:tRNA/rRNA methyltransferase